MKRSLRRIVIALAATVVYLLWHPEPTGTEIMIRHEWTVDPLAASTTVPAVESERIPFRTPAYFGYVDPDGALLYRGYPDYGVALARDQFIVYPRRPDSLVVQSASGGFLFSLPVAGYPTYVEDRLFTVSIGADRLDAWDATGRLGWSIPLSAPPTSMAAGEDVTVIGLITGGILVADGSGTLLRAESEEPGYFAYGPVLGTAVSDNSRRIAALLGVPESAIVILERVGATVVPIAHRPLTDVKGTRSAVQFVFGDEALVYQHEGGLAILGLPSATERRVTSEFDLVEVETAQASEVLLAVTQGESLDPARGFRRPAELLVISRTGVVRARVQFAGNYLDLRREPGFFVLTVDDRLLALSIGEG